MNLSRNFCNARRNAAVAAMECEQQPIFGSQIGGTRSTNCENVPLARCASFGGARGEGKGGRGVSVPSCDRESPVASRGEERGVLGLARGVSHQLKSCGEGKNSKIATQKLTCTKNSTGCRWVGAIIHSTGTSKSVDVCSVLEFESVRM